MVTVSHTQNFSLQQFGVSSTRASIASCTSLPPTHVFTTIGIYKGERVAIKKIAKKKVKSQSTDVCVYVCFAQTATVAAHHQKSFIQINSKYAWLWRENIFRWISHQYCCGKSSKRVISVTRIPYVLSAPVSICHDQPYSFWPNIVRKVCVRSAFNNRN